MTYFFQDTVTGAYFPNVGFVTVGDKENALQIVEDELEENLAILSLALRTNNFPSTAFRVVNGSMEEILGCRATEIASKIAWSVYGGLLTEYLESLPGG